MISLVDTDVYSLKAEVEDDTFYLHMDYKLNTFHKSIYQELLSQWGEILQGLKLAGVKQVGSIVHKADINVQKFQTMFGLELFKETDSVYIYRIQL